MKKRIASLLAGVLAAALALSMSMTAFAASSLTAKQWKVYVEHGSIHCEGAGTASADTKPPVWQAAWLPDGWALEYGSILNGVWASSDWRYICGEEALSFRCLPPSDRSFSCWMDLEAGAKTPKREVSVQGCQGYYWKVNKASALAWEDKNGVLFVMTHDGSLTQAELEKIAGSMVEVTGKTLPEYKLGWVPEESGQMRRSMTMPGYERQVNSEGNYLRFDYANQALAVPEGTPETVTVQGVQGQLWLGDANAKGIAVTSPITGKTVELPTEDTWSTLIWTDPETGICFRVQGNKLPKETMLRMAESAAPAEAASGSAQSAGGGKASGKSPEASNPAASTSPR